MTSIVAAAHVQEQAPAAPSTPCFKLDWAAIEEETFLDLIRDRFGLKPDDWARVLKALLVTKLQNAQPEIEDDLGHITPLIFLGSLFKNREDYFALIGLALDMRELTVADLPEVVLHDDGESRHAIRGVAVPSGVDAKGETIWDESRLELVITSKIDPGSQPMRCKVSTVNSGDYIRIDQRRRIRAEMPQLYARLERYGLFTTLDKTTGQIRPHSPRTVHILIHRLILAAGGVNVAGLEADHLYTSTGAWYGGASTFDAHPDALKARTHEDHTAITIKRGERHIYNEREGTGSRSTRDWAQDAAEGLAVLRGVFEEASRRGVGDGGPESS